MRRNSENVLQLWLGLVGWRIKSGCTPSKLSRQLSLIDTFPFPTILQLELSLFQQVGFGNSRQEHPTLSFNLTFLLALHFCAH
jgi:hypothetical protein